MSEVEELELRIRNLPSERLAELRDWFYRFDDEAWDQQIQADYRAGKFANLIDQARKELADGKAREL